jgi:hypothetical protein
VLIFLLSQSTEGLRTREAQQCTPAAPYTWAAGPGTALAEKTQQIIKQSENTEPRKPSLGQNTYLHLKMHVGSALEVTFHSRIRPCS